MGRPLTLLHPRLGPFLLSQRSVDYGEHSARCAEKATDHQPVPALTRGTFHGFVIVKRRRFIVRPRQLAADFGDVLSEAKSISRADLSGYCEN